MIYWIFAVFLSVVALFLWLDLKCRRNFNRNVYLDPETNTQKVIPYRDPIVTQIESFYRLLTGKARGKEALRLIRKDLAMDVDGSTKLRLLQTTFMNLSIVTIWDADIARAVLFAKDTDLGKLDNFGRVQERLVGDSIIQVAGEEWQLHKQALSPAFVWQHIKESHPSFIAIVNELASHLNQEKDKPIEIYPWIQKATLDAIGKIGFGYEFHAMQGENRSKEIRDYDALIEELANPIHFFEKFTKLTGKYNVLSDKLSKFEDFMANLIATKRENIKKDEDWQPKDILDHLLFSAESELLTDKQISRDLNIFFVAGHETTAGALANAIHYLAENPECQKKAREEVLSICGNNSPSNDDIKNMTYVHNCIKETLRKCPPAFGVIRSAKKDQKVGNLFLTEGSLPLVHIYQIHHDPFYWGDDVFAFKPERFDPENSKNRHRYAFMPFSIGSRQCIGNNFAMLEMRSFLAVLLQKFEFTPNPQSVEKFGDYIGTAALCPPPQCTLLLKSLE